VKISFIAKKSCKSCEGRRGEFKHEREREREREREIERERNMRGMSLFVKFEAVF